MIVLSPESSSNRFPEPESNAPAERTNLRAEFFACGPKADIPSMAERIKGEYDILPK
jgi:hypothetical protein